MHIVREPPPILVFFFGKPLIDIRGVSCFEVRRFSPQPTHSLYASRSLALVAWWFGLAAARQELEESVLLLIFF
jgi:hypothetical protein